MWYECINSSSVSFLLESGFCSVVKRIVLCSPMNDTLIPTSMNNSVMKLNPFVARLRPSPAVRPITRLYHGLASLLDMGFWARRAAQGVKTSSPVSRQFRSPVDMKTQENKGSGCTSDARLLTLSQPAKLSAEMVQRPGIGAWDFSTSFLPGAPPNTGGDHRYVATYEWAVATLPRN